MDMFNKIPPNTEFHSAILDIFRFQQLDNGRANLLTAIVAGKVNIMIFEVASNF